MLRLSRPAGFVLIALLLAAVFTLSLPGRLYWHRVVQDAGHGPVFAGIAIVLALMRPVAANTGRHSRADFAWAFGVAVALGIATELLQHFLPNRNVSTMDVLHDAAGAALGLAIVAMLERTPRTALAVGVALGALLILAWEPLKCTRAYAERAAAFPQLAPMGGVADQKFVVGRRRDDHPRALARDLAPTGGARRVEAPISRWGRPALELTEATPDWRGHSVLAIDLTNPGSDPAHLILRVLDARHDWSHEDRLNLPVTVPPRTRTSLRVSMAAIEHAPARRTMDLAGDRERHAVRAQAPGDRRALRVARLAREVVGRAGTGGGW